MIDEYRFMKRVQKFDKIINEEFKKLLGIFYFGFKKLICREV